MHIAFLNNSVIGILGERYGWIPNTVPPEVLAKQAWIQEHVGQRTSVTELEILHGVMRNPKIAGHAFFYFRDPAYIARLPEDEQVEMVERDIPDDIKEFGPTEAARRTQNRKDKLADLKETIRKSQLPLVDPYANPEALAAVVRQQFLNLIDALYPKEQVPDPLDQEAIGHRTYARRKLLACIDRPTHLAALDAFADASADGLGIVVTGDSGGGKTALLAAWGSRYRHAHPDHFIMQHFFGATRKPGRSPKLAASFAPPGNEGEDSYCGRQEANAGGLRGGLTVQPECEVFSPRRPDSTQIRARKGVRRIRNPAHPQNFRAVIRGQARPFV